MTRDDVIRMAQEAGFETGTALCEVVVRHSNGSWVGINAELIKFAHLVAAAERKACARRFRPEMRRMWVNYERAVKILTSIHALLYPPVVTDANGQTWKFKSPVSEEQMQELSDRIRAIPDELAALDAAAIRARGDQ